MLCNPVNKDQVNVISGGSDLDLNMGKIGIVAFAFVGKGRFDFSFALVSKPRSMAEKVISLMDVNSSSLEEWIRGKMLTG